MAMTCCALCAPAQADEPASAEFQVKAAMIYNFAQFVEWPADAFNGDNAVLIIGVVGQNPFGDYLDKLVAGKTIAGHPVVVRYFPAANRVTACHLLFVPRSQDANLGTIFTQIKAQAVL